MDKRSELMSSEITKRYYLGDLHPGVYFLLREAQCVAYLLRELNAETTAKFLRLSHRTVEFYIMSAQRKLRCASKKQLIKALQNSDFTRYLEELLSVEAVADEPEKKLTPVD